MKYFSAALIFLLVFSAGCELFMDEPEKPQQLPQAQPENEGFGCVDIDGFDYYYKSYVIADKAGTHIEDYCIDSDNLGETFCRDGKAVLDTVKCPAGCKDGTCIFSKEEPEASFEHPSEPQTCFDADGGTNYATASYIVIGGKDSKQYYDKCVDSKFLQEWFCKKDGSWDAILYDCQGSCTNSICTSIGSSK